MKVYGLLDDMPFGKYKGTELRQVIEDDPDYISWALSNVEWFALSTTAEEYFSNYLLDKEDADIFYRDLDHFPYYLD